MSWEVAAVVGTLAVSFYLLYLKNQVQSEALKLLLMFMSVLTTLTGVAHIAPAITRGDPGAASNIAIANGYYIGYVAFMVFFISFILLQLIGGWLKAWQRRR